MSDDVQPSPKKPRKRMSKKQVQATENQPVTLPQVEVKPEIDDDEPVDQTTGLNQLRTAFVEAITGEAFGNATKAAKLAGYSDSNQNVLKATASRLLTFVNVQKAIARRLASRRMDAESIRQDIATLCNADMAHFLKVGPDGQPEFDWQAAAAAGAIGQVKEFTEEGIEREGKRLALVKRRFKIHDKLRALELLAKLNGMLTEKHQHTVEVTTKEPFDFDAYRRAKAEERATNGDGCGRIPTPQNSN